MSDTQKATTDTMGVVRAINEQVVSLGIAEKAQVKFHKTMANAPIVKQWTQLKRWTAGITKAHKARTTQTEGEKDAGEQGQNTLTVVQKLTAIVTSYGLAAKIAGKGTSTLSKGLFSLASSSLFIFGIILVVVLAFVALAAVFADVNSPLAQMLMDIPLVGEVFNGFKIILTGEDGESGVKGAIDVLVVSLIAGAAAWLLFGAPVAILVVTVLAAVGIFRFMKNKTDSTVAALIAAGAVVMAGLGVLFLWIGGAWATFAGAVMFPIALILAGFTGMWLSLTGEISYWWGVISAIGAAIGIALLATVVFTGFVLSLPVILVIAAAAALIFTIVYYWDEIKAFFVAAWNYLSDLGVSVWNTIEAGWNSFETWFVGILKGMFDIVFFIPKKLWSGILLVIALWPRMKSKMKEVTSGIFKWFFSIGDKIKKKWTKWMTTLRGIPTKLKEIGLGIIRKFTGGLASGWNKVMPMFTVKKWMTKLPGVPDSWKGKGFLPEIKTYASGGIISSPTIGMVGEAGAEAVIPLKSGSVPVTMRHAGTNKDMIKAMHHLGQILEKSGNTFNISINPSGLVVESERAREKFAKEMSKEIMRVIQKETVGSMTSPIKTIGSWF